MNRTPDVELVLRDYFADDGLTAPDHVLDVVEARIGHQRQRHSWRLPWRHPMSTNIKLVAGLAAIVLVAVVGWQFLPGLQSDVGGPATPTPAAPTIAPTEAASPMPLPDGAIAGGRYRFRPFTEVSGLSVVANIPAGWSAFGGGWFLAGPGTHEADAVGISFLTATGLFSDPCHWDVDGTGDSGQLGDVAVGPATIDLVNALRASTAYTSTAASPVSIGAFSGYELEIQLPAEIARDTCDREAGGSGSPPYPVFSGPGGGLYAQGDGNRWHLSILDIDGSRVIVVRHDFAGTPAASRDAADAIIESLEFTP